MNTLPHELHVFIGSFLNHIDLLKYTANLDLKFTETDYLQLMNYNYPTMICQDIIKYDITNIYTELLKLDSIINSYMRHNFNNYNKCLKLHIDHNDVIGYYFNNLIKYLMMNNFIGFRKAVISIQDDVDMFKRFRDNFDGNYEDFLYNGSINIIKCLTEDNYVFDYNLILDVFKHQDIDLDIVKLVTKTYDSYNLFELMILCEEIDTATYLLSLINIDQTYSDKINTILIKNIKYMYHYSIFELIYSNFKHLSTDNIILQIYDKLLMSESKGFGTDRIKIITKLANHPMVREKYLM